MSISRKIAFVHVVAGVLLSAIVFGPDRLLARERTTKKLVVSKFASASAGVRLKGRIDSGQADPDPASPTGLSTVLCSSNTDDQHFALAMRTAKRKDEIMLIVARLDRLITNYQYLSFEMTPCTLDVSRKERVVSSPENQPIWVQGNAGRHKVLSFREPKHAWLLADLRRTLCVCLWHTRVSREWNALD